VVTEAAIDGNVALSVACVAPNVVQVAFWVVTVAAIVVFVALLLVTIDAVMQVNLATVPEL
jgi:hypothetical protein